MKSVLGWKFTGTDINYCRWRIETCPEGVNRIILLKRSKLKVQNVITEKNGLFEIMVYYYSFSFSHTYLVQRTSR